MLWFIPVRYIPCCFQYGLVSNNLALPLHIKNMLLTCYWTRLLFVEITTGRNLYWSLALYDVFFENLNIFQVEMSQYYCVIYVLGCTVLAEWPNKIIMWDFQRDIINPWKINMVFGNTQCFFFSENFKSLHCWQSGKT